MKANIKRPAVFIILIFFAFSCAANRPQGELDATGDTGEDIDSLFGISNDEESSKDSDEDEVLKLLGITKDESEESTETVVSTEGDKEGELRGEISSLENQLSQKESEIADLKSEIASKDSKITDLESNKSTQRYSTSYSATGVFKEDYQNALSEYYNRNYKTAINAFEALLARDYNNSLSDNCQYWIGECYYGLKKYNQAIVEFTKVFSFNNSNKFDDAQLKLGLCYWQLGDKVKAKEEFERLISDYPQSEYIQKAEYFLSRF